MRGRFSRNGVDRLPKAGGEPPSQGDEHGMTGEAKGQLRIVAGRFAHDRRAMGSLIVFLGLAVASILVTEFWKYKFSQITGDFSKVLYRISANGSLVPGKIVGGPSGKHPFGVDPIGHDMLAQVMQGTKSEILTAFVVAVIAMLIGTAIGAVAGFYGKWVDSLLMRFTDIVLAVPLLVVLIVLANRFSKSSSGWLPIALVIAVLAWTYLARLVRADFLSLRERDFVEAARAIGAPNRRIIIRHMLPNAIGPIIVNGTLTVANAIILESTLSFLGLGIQPPDVSLGQLVASGQDYATNEWWLFAFPAAFIVAMVLCVNFIGDGLRAAFDPHSRRVRA
jgi:ABC-type dipeptide/oligopeptide/nickel transport system permease subunit